MATAFKMKEKVSHIWSAGLVVIGAIALVSPVVFPLSFAWAGFFVVWACLYYINVLRWKAVRASSFVCDTNGEFLHYIRADAYVLNHWLKENNADIRRYALPDSFRIRVRVFVVGVGEVVLSAKGKALACDPRIVFDRIVRPKVDVVETVRSVLEEVLLAAEPAHMTRSDLIERVREAIESKIPRQALHVHVVFDVKRADRFIIPS